MKRVLAISVTVILAFAALASAQSATTKPLADVAKAEEARRKTIKKPAKVYTNGDLRADPSRGTPAEPAPATPAQAADATSASPAPDTTAAEKPAAELKDQAYWAGRMKAARDVMDRQQIFLDSLQSRINALTTDFVNRDDPAQRAKIEADRKTALAEMERVKKELEEQTKAIQAIEDEARRAGVPPGWLRPGE